MNLGSLFRYIVYTFVFFGSLFRVLINGATIVEIGRAITFSVTYLH